MKFKITASKYYQKNISLTEFVESLKSDNLALIEKTNDQIVIDCNDMPIEFAAFTILALQAFKETVIIQWEPPSWVIYQDSTQLSYAEKAPFPIIYFSNPADLLYNIALFEYAQYCFSIAPPFDEFIPITVIATYWGISDGGIRKAIYDGRLPKKYSKTVNRRIYVHPAGMKIAFGEKRESLP